MTAIAVAGAAYEMGAIETVLVVAPTSVCSVWPKEFDEYANFKYKVNVLLGDKKHRLKELEALKAFPFKALKVAYSSNSFGQTEHTDVGATTSTVSMAPIS